MHFLHIHIGASYLRPSVKLGTFAVQTHRIFHICVQKFCIILRLINNSIHILRNFLAKNAHRVKAQYLKRKMNSKSTIKSALIFFLDRSTPPDLPAPTPTSHLTTDQWHVIEASHLTYATNTLLRHIVAYNTPPPPPPPLPSKPFAPPCTNLLNWNHPRLS